MKIIDAYDLYIQYIIVEKGLSNQTVECYKEDLNIFFNFKGVDETSDLEYSDIDNFISYLSSLGKSTKTILRRATTVRNFFNFMQQENIFKKESTIVEMPKLGSYLPNVLSTDDVELLFTEPLLLPQPTNKSISNKLHIFFFLKIKINSSFLIMAYCIKKLIQCQYFLSLSFMQPLTFYVELNKKNKRD